MILHQISNSYKNYNYNAYIYKNTEWIPHFHGNYELIYALSGDSGFTLNGKVDRISSGELVLISPYTIHSLEIDENSELWVGVFSEDFVISFFEKTKSARYSKFKCSPDIDLFLRKHLFFQGTPELYMLISCLYMVCNECIKNATAYDGGMDGEFMYEIINYISQHISDNITQEDISGFLGYERHYFSSLFHKCFAMNFRKFVNIFRFEKACRLLADKNLDITNICTSCGFGSIRNFNRIFKDMSGMTPGDYRKSLKQPHFIYENV